MKKKSNKNKESKRNWESESQLLLFYERHFGVIFLKEECANVHSIRVEPRKIPFVPCDSRDEGFFILLKNNKEERLWRKKTCSR
jgi:hypothetical protein